MLLLVDKNMVKCSRRSSADKLPHSHYPAEGFNEAAANQMSARVLPIHFPTHKARFLRALRTAQQLTALHV